MDYPDQENNNTADKLWICPSCSEELGEYNAYCVYCYYSNNASVKIFNPTPYFIREICIESLVEGHKAMTPQEELFRDLFNHELVFIKDMDTLTLRAHRDEISKIAFEARVRLTAIDHDENEKKKAKRRDGKPTGFERSLNVDETTSDAINTIKDRQKKLTGKEKMLAGLTDLYIKGGMSQAEAQATAEKAMGAGAIKAQVEKKADEVRSPLSQENGFTLPKFEKPVEHTADKQGQTLDKPVIAFNPFAKKSE